MKADLTQIAYEVESLAAMVTDRAAIARHISAVHGVNYYASDIEKILLGIKPTNSVPRALRQTKLMVEPIAWSPPISTNRSGVDPLVKAIARYHAKRTNYPVRAHWEALAA